MVNFYEGGQCLLEDSGVKLSQIFDKNEENREKELQQVSSVPIDSKGNKKKRKIKRKREENDSNSSFTATASDMMKVNLIFYSLQVYKQLYRNRLVMAMLPLLNRNIAGTKGKSPVDGSLNVREMNLTSKTTSLIS